MPEAFIRFPVFFCAKLNKNKAVLKTEQTKYAKVKPW
jgi:hypothetical protein